MQHICEICVVGNGAIGKTAALAFAQAGLSVTLLAQVHPNPKAPTTADAVSPAESAWDVRVFALNHVAHQLLSGLRVWDAMDQSRIAPVEAMDVRGDGEKQAGHIGFDAYGARTDALAWIVEDANLNQALDAALRFASNVKVIEASCADLQQGTNSASLALNNGDTVSAQLIVGADGAQSWIRARCDIGISSRAYGQTAIVSNFACNRPHCGVAHQWFTAHEGIVALLPLAGDRVSLVWSAPDAIAEQLLAEAPSVLAQKLAPYADEVLGGLTPLEPHAVKNFPLRLLRTHALTAPRVALIGDAAHVIHPMAGHGMNLGFADIVDLVKAVTQRESARDCGDARVLARYARSRKEDILLMQLATDGLNRLFSADFEPLRVARNVGMSLLDKLPFLKTRLISHAMGRRP